MRDIAMKFGLSILTACAGGTAWILAEPGARGVVSKFVGIESAEGSAAKQVPLDLTPNPAAKPSFDCAEAGTTIEKVICSDPSIAEADRTLARVWANLRDQGKITDEVRMSQRQWIAMRDACLIDDDAKACVRREMLARIATLGKL